MVKAMNMPLEQVKYVGEDTPVSCPVCHCNIYYIENDLPEIMCPTCQIHGTVSSEGGKFRIIWNLEDTKQTRFSTVGEHHHMEWIARHRAEEEPQIAMPETQEKIKAYKAYGKYIKPDNPPK